MSDSSGGAVSGFLLATDVSSAAAAAALSVSSLFRLAPSFSLSCSRFFLVDLGAGSLAAVDVGSLTLLAALLLEL